MMKLIKNRGKHGSAILTAIGIGFVLLVLVGGMQTFMTQRIRMTTSEVRNLMALGVAEAGLNAVITEIRQDASFRTHSMKPDGTWDAKLTVTPTLKADTAAPHRFSASVDGKGDYSGTLGPDGTYKVRIGLINTKDDSKTLNIDESQCYIKVESLGRVGDTVRRIEAVLQRRFLGREFLMYDGDVLSLIFGMPSDPGFNVFGRGHLYGRNAVEIGRILNAGGSPSTAGTKQRLDDIEMIKCGVGGIFFYSPTEMSFRKIERLNLPEIPRTTYSTNQAWPSARTYASNEADIGEIPNELKTAFPPIPDSVATYVKDGRVNDVIEIGSIPLERYKQLANSSGGMLSSGGTPYKLPNGFPPAKKLSSTGDDDVYVLDFGNKSPYIIRSPNGIPNIPDGGVIYSDKSIVIKGNPEKNLKIVSEGNIFIAGDFNQAGNYSSNEDLYGLSQKYGGDPENSDFFDYKKTGPSDPGSRLNSDSSGTLHKTVEVIANERVVYDYRNPMDCFENELYPFLKYQLAEKLINNSNNTLNQSLARTAALTPVPKSSNAIQCNTTDTAASVTKRINDLFKAGGIYDLSIPQADLDTLANKFGDAYTSAPPSNRQISGEILDNLTKEVLTVMKDQCKDGTKPIPGIKKMLNALKNMAKTAANQNSNDYVFYPEMTTNGMFTAGAQRNAKWYFGPDVARWYDEIGNKDTNCTKEHAGSEGFIHRMFGSEIRIAKTPVHKITGQGGFSIYSPPRRRKIYDPSMPKISNAGLAANDLSAFQILTWKDTKATPAEFDNF